DLLACGVIWCDGRTDGDATRFGDLGRDIADTPDVEVAMLSREPELGREVPPDEIAVEDRQAPAASLEELDLENVGDGGFARSRKARKEDGESLLEAGSMAAAKLPCDLRVREPLRQVRSSGEALPQLGAGDVHRLQPGRHLILGKILVALRHVHQHLKRNHADADLVRVPAKDLLRFVWAIERSAITPLAGSRVIAADDDVR